MVQVEGLSLNYYTSKGEVQALKDVNLVVKKREFVSIVGPSGCGKSTLLSLIIGLLQPTEGLIRLDGELVQGIQKKVGYMLQQDYLFAWRTIVHNVLLGLEVQRKKRREKVEEAKEMIRDYGLGGFENHYPHQLSGGMRQRVALIRTLILEPEVLLLDEPFSALDYQNRLAVGSEVAGILQREGKTVIMVTHDIPEAISMADRVVVMTPRPGKIRSSHSIELDKEKDPLKRRESPSFPDYFTTVWKELNKDGRG